MLLICPAEVNTMDSSGSVSLMLTKVKMEITNQMYTHWKNNNESGFSMCS